MTQPLTQSLIIAVPSKGRLEEKAAELFAAADMKLNRAGARGYTGTLDGINNVEIAYLSAREIATRLRAGAVHFGITGEDLLREEVPDLQSSIQLVTPLGFGHADVVVAIPHGWVDVTTMADLAEVAADFRATNGKSMRVATKYTHLTTDYFVAKGVQDIQIVNSFGATEGAPASGAAELIVDITSTGATLTANDLRVLEDGVILKSQANLAASLTADWSDEARQAAKQILARLGAYQEAQKLRLVFLRTKSAISRQSNMPDIIAETKEKFGAEFASYTNSDVDLPNIYVPRENVYAFTDYVHNKGFDSIAVTKPDFIFAKTNPLYERLAGAL